jgi:hypothetical protein
LVKKLSKIKIVWELELGFNEIFLGLNGIDFLGFLGFLWMLMNL